jgi:hypothetical protein
MPVQVEALGGDAAVVFSPDRAEADPHEADLRVRGQHGARRGLDSGAHGVAPAGDKEARGVATIPLRVRGVEGPHERAGGIIDLQGRRRRDGLDEKLDRRGPAEQRVKRRGDADADRGAVQGHVRVGDVEIERSATFTAEEQHKQERRHSERVAATAGGSATA